jgi:hypothetical protein
LILFVADSLDGLEPLDELGSAPIVAPITDPASDWDFFQEERAPGKLRTLPHVVVDVELAAFGFTPCGAFHAIDPDAQRALADSDDRDEPIATLRKLARVAEARGALVYAYRE